MGRRQDVIQKCDGGRKLRDFVIALNENNLLVVLSKEDYDRLTAAGEKYVFVDDSDSAFKAKIKAKEIRALGTQEYLNARKETA